MTNFHPDAQWLSEYVAGTLADSEALCVSTHLTYCEQCRKETADLMHFGATLFDHQQGTDDTLDTALQQALSDIDSKAPDSLDQHSPDDAPMPAATDEHKQLPHVIRKLINKNANELSWRKIGNKISMARLNDLGDEKEITLHKLQPGSSVSEHDHHGREITVVLDGSFSDDDGQYFPGDFLIREPGETHHPKANEECLCLAVCDAPVKFTGLFARLLNPLVAFQHNR